MEQLQFNLFMADLEIKLQHADDEQRVAVKNLVDSYNMNSFDEDYLADDYQSLG